MPVQSEPRDSEELAFVIEPEAGPNGHALPGSTAGTATLANAYAARVKTGYQSLRAHGVLAEEVNHTLDVLRLRNAVHTGGNNLRNGCDRIVDGVEIQSKYCATGSSCIKECFEGGQFKYYSTSGAPQHIEVPKGLGADAIEALKSRIGKGQVSGVTDPAEAENLVREGNLTHEQSLKLARAGTIESVMLDAKTGAVIAGCSFGLSAAVSFAQTMWEGQGYAIATKNALHTGLTVGGKSFATAILTTQLARTGTDRLMMPASRAVVETFGPQLTSKLALGLSGKTLTGAAATQHVAKLLRGTVVTTAVSTVVLSSVDAFRLCTGSISGSQAFKNVTNTTVSVVAGTGGWMGGAAVGATIGTALFPGVGTTIGAGIGAVFTSVAAGGLASWLSGKALDAMIDDDAIKMAAILERMMADRAYVYLLSKSETETFIAKVSGPGLPALLRDLFEAPDRETYCRRHCNVILDRIVAARAKVSLPSLEEFLRALSEAAASSEQPGEGNTGQASPPAAA